MGQILTLAIPFNTPDQRKNYTALVGRYPDLGAWVEAVVDPKTRDAALDRLWDKAFRDRWKAVAGSYPHLSRWLEARIPGVGQLLRAPAPSPVAEWDFGTAPAGGDIRFASEESVTHQTKSLASLVEKLQPLPRGYSPPITLVVDIELNASGTIGVGEGAVDPARRFFLVFTRAGSLRLFGEVHLCLPFTAGRWQIFKPENPKSWICLHRYGGLVSAVPRVYPQWWGASPSATPAVNRRAIQDAIDSFFAAGRVFLPTGIYGVEGTVILQPNIVLEGESRDGTTLDFKSGTWGIADRPCSKQSHPSWLAPDKLSGTPVLSRMTLVGPYDGTKAQPFDEAKTPAQCGLRLAETFECHDLTIRGFQTGVLARPCDLDTPGPGAKYTFLNSVFDGLTIENAEWGLRFEGTTNWLRIQGVRFHRVGVAVLLARHIPKGGADVNAPDSMIALRDLSCSETRIGLKVLERYGVAALLVDGCDLDCTEAAVLTLNDRIQKGACIGFCRRSSSAQITIPDGSGQPHPFVTILRRGGRASDAPGTSDGWTAGDRVWNDFSGGNPSSGTPVGWVFVGPGTNP